MFGHVISEARKKAGFTQKQLAALIIKEDGDSISLAYLNDIEHGRRNRPSDHLIEQFARILSLSPAFLYYCANEIPIEIRGKIIDQKRFNAVYGKFLKDFLEAVAA